MINKVQYKYLFLGAELAEIFLSYKSERFSLFFLLLSYVRRKVIFCFFRGGIKLLISCHCSRFHAKKIIFSLKYISFYLLYGLVLAKTISFYIIILSFYIERAGPAYDSVLRFHLYEIRVGLLLTLNKINRFHERGPS